VITYIVRRIGQAIIVLIGVTLIVFILQHLLPGSIARAIIGPRASAAQIAAFNHQYGLGTWLPSPASSQSITIRDNGVTTGIGSRGSGGAPQTAFVRARFRI
jgi:ABC-type dipeptide/oligopeptide/nickel transport system permease component